MDRFRSAGICAIEFESRIHLFYRDVDGGGVMHHSWSIIGDDQESKPPIAMCR